MTPFEIAVIGFSNGLIAALWNILVPWIRQRAKLRKSSNF